MIDKEKIVECISLRYSQVMYSHTVMYSQSLVLEIGILRETNTRYKSPFQTPGTGKHVSFYSYSDGPIIKVN